jgi:predicted Zn-dependent protease with MMP-like domain
MPEEPMMDAPSAADFAAIVAEALEALPDWVRDRLDNVAVLTADWPTPEQRRKAQLPADQLLLGLYEGIPTIHRGRGYNMALPDRVTLFRGPMLQITKSKAELIAQVQRTLLHELGHHLGLSEQDLQQLGH